MPEKTKPTVFISHVHEDGALAAKLSSSIKDAFLGAVDVFVANDGASIRGGDKWMQKIEENLRHSQIVLVILSRHSAARKWVYFETGGAFFLGARVIPLLDGSLSVSELGPPLNYLQVCILHDPIHLHHIFSLIAESADMNTPEVNFTMIAREMTGSISTEGTMNNVAERMFPNGESTEPENASADIVADTAKKQVQQVFESEVKKYKNSTGEEQKSVQKIIDILLSSMLKGEPPDFFVQRYKDTCIADEKLYFAKDSITMASEMLDASDTTNDQKVQLLQWMGRLLSS